jgi:purine-binding chemotaxis protein CheW
MPDAARGQQREIVLFALDGQRYGLWAADVRELLRAVAILPLPRAPRIVEGVINLRGRVVPVLDFRGRFGLPRKDVEPSDHLIVAAVGPRLVAIRADRALDLVPITFERAHLEELRAAGGAAYLAGVARLPDGLALIHDLAAFLSADESAALEEALGAGAGAPA